MKKIIIIFFFVIIFIFSAVQFLNVKVVVIDPKPIDIKSAIKLPDNKNDTLNLLYSHIFNNKKSIHNLETNSMLSDNNIDYSNLYIKIIAFNKNFSQNAKIENHIFEILENHINVYDIENYINSSTANNVFQDASINNNKQKEYLNRFFNYQIFNKDIKKYKKQKYYLTELQYYLTHQEAEKFIINIKQKYPELISKYQFIINKVQIEDKFLFIVNAFGFKSFEEAKSLCNKLINNKETCLVIQNKI